MNNTTQKPIQTLQELAKKLKSDRYYFVSPCSAGDTYYICAFKRALEKHLQGKIIFVIKPTHKVVCEIYEAEYIICDSVFLNTFKQEAESCLTLEDTNAKSLEEYKKNLNPDTYFADMSDWFKEKQRENANMPMSKEVFKQEFYKYCKNGMTENEMKILLILDNKNPSKLTKEHKDMIKEGLKLCTTNNKLLDNGLHTAIEASLIDKNVKLTNNKVLDFAKTLEKMEKSNNPIDKKFLEGGGAQRKKSLIKSKTLKKHQIYAKKWQKKWTKP